jgi:hypothetical protein
MKFRKSTVIFISLGLLLSGRAATAAGQLAPRNVYIHDENGDPITGGAVTWSMKDRSARSAKTYGLTSDGLITFPYAPLGEATVKITNGLMATGDYVSGSYAVTLSDDNEIQIALAPKHNHTVQVAGPDGDGIAGALVTLNAGCQVQVWNDELTWVAGYYAAGEVWVPGYYDFDSQWVAGYFESTEDWVAGHYEGGYEEGYGSTTLRLNQSNKYGNYTAPDVTESTYSDTSDDDVYIATTDSSGVATFKGYFESSDCLEVTASYNDGIVIQNASGTLESDTPISLPYVPIVTVSTDTVTAKEGTAIQIPISVGISGQSNVRQNLQRSNVVAAPGAAVKLVLPPGASKGSCGAKLSGTTNSRGQVTLRVCATKSGKYRIVAKGILRDTGVVIRVKGAAPLSVSSASASSPAVGVLKASWNAPLYTGGASITGYEVLVVDANGRSSKRSLSAASKSLRITGLGHATKYTIKIFAKTKFGKSDPIIKTVTVA